MDTVAFRFIKTINKYLEALANEQNGDKVKRMNEIRQLEQVLSGKRMFGNMNNYRNGNIDVQNYETTVDNLKGNIILLRAIDKENKTEGIATVQKILKQIETIMQQIVKPEKDNVHENRQKRVNVCEDFEQRKINAILERFMEMVAKFRKCLNEDELGGTIYFLEDAKASWAKEMDEIKQREYELTTVYLLGNDIAKEFGDIEKVYNLKLKELNRKINELKEIDKAKQTVETETLVKLMKESPTEKHQATQMADIKTVVMGNIQLDRLRRKIHMLQNCVNYSRSTTHNFYSAESTKATLEKQMDQIEQLENEMAAVYSHPDDCDKKNLKYLNVEYHMELNDLNLLIGKGKKGK